MSDEIDQPQRWGSVHADLGYSVILRGDPQDSELLRAAADGELARVRKILLGRPYRLDPHVVDRIVADLESGRAAP
jgi:hypothetical protein